jgi:hypothetical protein
MPDQRQLGVKAPSTKPEMTTFASNVEANMAELHQILDKEIRALEARISALEASP